MRITLVIEDGLNIDVEFVSTQFSEEEQAAMKKVVAAIKRKIGEKLR